MLVILDESLIDLKKDDLKGTAALESVLAASFNGQHLVIAPFTVTANLLSLSLSVKANAVVKRLRGTASFAQEIKSRTPYSLRICLTGKMEKDAGGHVWQIPLYAFANRAVPNSIVLAENLDDAHAYISSAFQARIKSQFKEAINAEPQGGGGSTIGPALMNIVNREIGLCFCITDGDYRHPLGTASTSSKNCSRTVRNSNWPALARDIPGRSIENIFPIKLLEDSYQIAVPETFHRFKELANRAPIAARYIDVKNGISHCQIKKLPENDEKKFWNSELHAEIKAFEEKKDKEKCEGEVCNKCVLVQGLGKNILRQVTDHFTRQSIHKLAERSENGDWNNLGNEIFHWCIADQPLRL